MLIAIHDPDYEGQSRLLAIRANTHGFGNIVSSGFTPVLAKHTKSFNLVDALSLEWIAFSGTADAASPH